MSVAFRRWKIFNQAALELKRATPYKELLQRQRSSYYSERKSWASANREEVEEGHSVIREIERLRKDEASARATCTRILFQNLVCFSSL